MLFKLWLGELQELIGTFLGFPEIIKKSSEAVARRCSVENVFLEVSQIHRKAPVPESLF